MTKQEFLDKYGHIKLSFLEYYKYTFIYVGKLEDDKHITCFVGLTADDIYQHEVIADQLYSIKDLNPHEGVVYDDEEVLYRFYDAGT